MDLDAPILAQLRTWRSTESSWGGPDPKEILKEHLRGLIVIKTLQERKAQDKEKEKRLREKMVSGKVGEG